MKKGNSAFNLNPLFSELAPLHHGIVPYGGISFATFETLKAAYQRNARPPSHDDDSSTGGEEEAAAAAATMPVALKLLAGATAGLTAQTATYPIHVVRRRMQLQAAGAAAGGAPLYSSVWAGLSTIYRTEAGRSKLDPALTIS